MTITKRDAALLKKQVGQGENPKLPPKLWWTFHSARSIARIEPMNPNLLALQDAGLVDRYGAPTKRAEWYTRTINGQYERDVRCDC